MNTSAAIYRTSIAHVRRTPLHNAFTYRSYSWYVDVDALPSLPRWLAPLAGFSVADHLGDPDGTLRGNVERYLATQGITLDGGRITMLASARVFGHVFNPLSLFWCHDPAGGLRCVIAEVHNTYGERHCYLLETDDAGRATVPKAFYVSPFNDVEGRYRMKLPEPAERLAVSIVLEREGRSPSSPLWTASAAKPPCRTSWPRRSPSRWRRCVSQRRSAGRESNSGHASCPSSKDHTTPHRRQSSDHDRSDRTPHGADEPGPDYRPDECSGEPGCALHGAAAARSHRRRRLAQRCHRAFELQGPVGRPGRGRHLPPPPCADLPWRCATPTAPFWAGPRPARPNRARFSRS